MSASIAENQKKILQIKTDFDALLHKENPIFEKYCQKIDETTQKRFESLEKYHQSEIEAAQVLHDGSYYGIENDFERQKEDLVGNVDDFILFKYKMLVHEFPQAAEYFATNGKQSQFLNTFHSKYLLSNKEESTIQLSEEPLLSHDEIDSLFRDVSSKNEANYSFQDQSLIGPDGNYSIGSTAILKVGDGLEHHGVIQSLTDYFVVFLSDDGPLLQVPIKSFNMGLVSLSKT